MPKLNWYLVGQLAHFLFGVSVGVSGLSLVATVYGALTGSFWLSAGVLLGVSLGAIVVATVCLFVIVRCPSRG